MSNRLSDYPHVHVDIETLGLRPTSTILSIGAVLLDFESERITKEMHVNIDPADCEFFGLTTDESTVRWWKFQSDAAKARTLDPNTRTTLGKALDALTDFLPKSSFELWVCGPDFDVSILVNAYRVTMKTVPWAFWSVRDYRTLRETFPDIKAPVKNKAAHDALEDARYQALHTLALFRAVKQPKVVSEL